MALRERHAHFPRFYLTTFCQYTLLKSNFGLIRHCAAHTSKTLSNSFYSSNSTQTMKVNNERKGSGQGMLSQSLAKVSAIIITVCTQSGCVELQPFAILWGNQGIWHRLSSRTGQSKYTVSTFLQPLIIFSLDGQDTGMRREETVIMAVALWSSPAIKLRGDGVWEWKWLSQQKIGSLFISAFISLLAVLIS